MDPMISVIVPVYKVERWLDKCVQSIATQTYQNLEIILVDDGSPDQCPQLCDKWAEQDKRIRVIHKANGGISSARNAGIDAANGEYLYFVDSDDYIAATLCETIMGIFSQYDVDIVTFDCCRLGMNGETLGGTETIREGVLLQEMALKELMLGHINHYAWNKMYRRRVFGSVRFPLGRVWEDMATCYKLFLCAERIYCCPEQLYYYCERSGSITGRITEKALEDIFCARFDSYHDLKEQYPEAGDIVFRRVALCALRLYDRSLWARVNLDILAEATGFLTQNKQRILQECTDEPYWLYYTMPGIYNMLRVAKHSIGKQIRKIQKK